jgi:uncharacterized membrane protein required for colicin V production
MWLANQHSPSTLAGPLGLELPWVDWVGLGLLVAFGLLGAWRGLWWQLFRVLAVAVCLGLARALSPLAAGKLLGHMPKLNPSVVELFGFLLIFVVALKLASLLGKFGANALKSMQLRPLDRLAGLLLGLLTGLAVHSAGVVGLRSFGPTVWAEESLTGSRSALLADRVVTDIERLWAHWPHLLERLRQALPEPVESGATPGADGPAPSPKPHTHHTPREVR